MPIPITWKSMMSEPVNIIRSFVEGRLEPADLEKLLGNDKELQAALATVEIYNRTSGEGLLCHIISMNFNDLRSIYVIQRSLADYLASIGVSFAFSSRYDDLLELLADAQPKWLSLPGDYLFSMIREFNSSGNSGNLKKWIKDEIKRRFVYANKPPKWLQGAQWPIVDGVPLKFIEQVENTAMHDTSCDYKFSDADNKIKIITQIA